MEEDISVSESFSISVVHNNGIHPSTVNLINETEGTRHLKLSGHQGEVFMCLWSPTRKHLASGSADGMCRLWNLDDMTDDKWNSGVQSDGTVSESVPISLSTSILPHSNSQGEKYKDVTSVTWSPDGHFLATGCYDGLARIWDNQGKLIMLLKEHTGPVFSLKWSKTNKYILSGSYDRRAIVWDTSTGTHPPPRLIKSIFYSPPFNPFSKNTFNLYYLKIRRYS